MQNNDNTLITDIVRVCARINDNRDEYKILGHAMSELGELAEEVTIHKGDSYKNAGSDGILGEAIDTILCLVDLIYIHCKRQGIPFSESMLQAIAETKLEKWENKVLENINAKNATSDWYSLQEVTHD